MGNGVSVTGEFGYQGAGSACLADGWRALACRGVFLLLARQEMPTFYQSSYIGERASHFLR